MARLTEVKLPQFAEAAFQLLVSAVDIERVLEQHRTVSGSSGRLGGGDARRVRIHRSEFVPGQRVQI